MPNFIARSSLRNDGPSWRRLSSWMHTTALSAFACQLVGVKSRKQWRQVLHQVGGSDLDAVDEGSALEAKPFEPVFVARCSGAFDDQPDGARNRALRRVAQMRRQQKDLALADRHVIDPARFGELQHYVATQLVEELLAGVVVEVDPLVRAADDHHDHAGVLEYQFVADRRLQ